MKHMKLKMTRTFAPELYAHKMSVIRNAVRSARYDTDSILARRGFPMLWKFAEESHAWKVSDALVWLEAYSATSASYHPRAWAEHVAKAVGR